MNKPTKQECIQWLAQVAQDLLPHIPTSARGGFQLQAQQAIGILSTPDPVVAEKPGEVL